MNLYLLQNTRQKSHTSLAGQCFAQHAANSALRYLACVVFCVIVLLQCAAVQAYDPSWAAPALTGWQNPNGPVTIAWATIPSPYPQDYEYISYEYGYSHCADYSSLLGAGTSISLGWSDTPTMSTRTAYYSGTTNCLYTDVYDIAGNPTTFRGTAVGSGNFNANNQSTAIGFTHDTKGKPISYKGMALAYDAENRLMTSGN